APDWLRGSPRALVKMLVNELGEPDADTLHGGKILHAGPAYGLGRTEMPQQCAFAGRSYACNFIERRHAYGLSPPRPVAADSEPMRLVAQPLDIIEDRIAGLQHHRRLAWHVEVFAAGIAVRALGDGYDGNIGNAEFIEHLEGGGQLTCAPIDQDQIGPRRHRAGILPCILAACPFLLDEAGKPPG